VAAAKAAHRRRCSTIKAVAAAAALLDDTHTRRVDTICHRADARARPAMEGTAVVWWPAGGGEPSPPLADRWCLEPVLWPPPSPPPPPPPRLAYGEPPGHVRVAGVYGAWSGWDRSPRGEGSRELGAHRILVYHPPTAAAGGAARRLLWRCTASVTDRGPRSDCDCENNVGRVPRRMRWCQGG